ncbi:hypothetical protein BH10ACT2_BH10ACT2_07580 [soil metagenome]
MAAVALLGSVAACSNDKSSDDAVSNPAPRKQVVLDYSPTLSDADALLYLASNPAVELLAVTLPGTGEADCEAGVLITRSLLVIADSAAVPVGCGRNEPLTGDRDWPEEWRDNANRLGEGLLPVVESETLADAEQLLGEILRTATQPITLIAVGPLTNVGAVLSASPDLAAKIERVVIMGGAVTVPGNVAASPAAEWNIYVDPEAARRVIAAGIAITFVPLDATNYLPWSERLLARLEALATDTAQTVSELAARASLDGFYMWDELAAMVAIEPGLVTTEAMSITIQDDGAIVLDSAGFIVDVAVKADADAAFEEFVGGLNGGIAIPVVPLSAAELNYMVQMGGVDSDFGAEIGHVFRSIDDANDDVRDAATSVLEGFLSAADTLLIELQAVSPPSSTRELHAEYVASISSFGRSGADLLAAVATVEGATLDELIDNALAAAATDDVLERVNLACRALVSFSFLHDGPRPCSAGG